MKFLIGVDIGSYTFNAGTKQVTLIGLNPVSLEQVLLITNVNTNKIIYQFNKVGFGGTILANVITLDFNTNAMSNLDNLQIFIDYEAKLPLPLGASTETTLIQVRDYLDTVETKLQSIINNAYSNTNIYYNEVLSVGSSILTTIITHTSVIVESLQSIIVSGTNIAEYSILLNGNVIIKIRTEFTSLNEIITLPYRGFKLAIGDVVAVKVIHLRPSTGDFNTTLKIDN